MVDNAQEAVQKGQKAYRSREFCEAKRRSPEPLSILENVDFEEAIAPCQHVCYWL